MRTSALALLGAFLLVWNLHAQTTAPSDEAKGAKDETTAVRRGDLSTTIELDGYFEPTESYEVRVRPKAYQGELLIAAAPASGASVKKGESLLQIDNEEINKQIAAAENELNGARANFAKAQADVQLGESADALAMKVQQTELSNAEAGLKWWEQVDGAHMIKGAELATKAARDNVEDQTDELEQLRKMYKSEELTNETADIVVKRALRARERAQVAQGMQEAKELKVKGFDYNVHRMKYAFGIEQQKQALAELTAKHAHAAVVRKTALVGAQIALDKAQTKFDELKEDQSQFNAEAPFDGVVYAGEFQQGRWPAAANPKALRKDEKVQPGSVVLTLVPAGKLRLMIDVPENKLQYVRPDMKVRVIPLVASDATTTGTFGTPSASPVNKDNMQAYPTPVTLEKVDPRLAAGQKATARIDVEATNVLLVPASAISKGRVKVKTADGKALWRDVIAGHTDGDVTEIRDGVKEGEQVLTKVNGK
jgi:multidrug resistance efflux pump